jgi:hypothetical protein
MSARYAEVIGGGLDHELVKRDQTTRPVGMAHLQYEHAHDLTAHNIAERIEVNSHSGLAFGQAVRHYGANKRPHFLARLKLTVVEPKLMCYEFSDPSEVRMDIESKERGSRTRMRLRFPRQIVRTARVKSQCHGEGAQCHRGLTPARHPTVRPDLPRAREHQAKHQVASESVWRAAPFTRRKYRTTLDSLQSPTNE